MIGRGRRGASEGGGPEEGGDEGGEGVGEDLPGGAVALGVYTRVALFELGFALRTDCACE